MNLNPIKEEKHEHLSQNNDRLIDNMEVISNKLSVNNSINCISENDNDPEYQRIMTKFMINNGTCGVMKPGGLFGRMNKNKSMLNQTMPLNYKAEKM